MKSWLKIGLYLLLCSLYSLCSVAGNNEPISGINEIAGHSEHSAMDALTALVRSANQGDATAQYTLAQAYDPSENGLEYGLEKDENQALRWYQESANNGNADASYDLSLAYVSGDRFGFERDHKQAFEWNKKAAEQGDITAQEILAMAYEYGWFHSLEVKKDLSQALEWYKKAAEQGNDSAQSAVDRITLAATLKSRPHIQCIVQ